MEAKYAHKQMYDKE